MAPAATPHSVLRCSRHAPGHLSRARRLVSGRFRTLPGAPPPHAPRPRPAAFRCGQPSPAPGFRSHGRSCSVWLPLSETSCSPPVGREQQDSFLPFRGRWRRVAHTPRLFFIRPPAGGRCERGGRGPLPEAVVSFPSDPYPGAGVLGRTGVLPVVLRGNAPPSPSLAPLRRRLFRTVFPVLSRRSEGQDPDPLCPTRRHHHSASQRRRTVCLGKETCKSGRFVGATGPKRGERVPWPAGPRAPFQDLGLGRTPLPSGQVGRARGVMRTTRCFSPTHALVPRGFPSATSGPFSG